MKNIIQISLLIFLTLIFLFVSQAWPQSEIREYEGKPLSSFDRKYDNSIKGPQSVDLNKYKLGLTGLVQQPLSLTYKEILTLPSVKRAITLHCIEGWDEHLLFKGVRLAELFKITNPKKEVQTVIFFAADGYSSSLSYKDIIQKDIMLAYEINGKTLDSRRGFPLQVVAESKYGYKWVKWVTRIELSDKPYMGYWEKLGYNNNADVAK
jgi:DMSO/TMAO reductase YedYZ molybdopterin-dependent catalytic subunit